MHACAANAELAPTGDDENEARGGPAEDTATAAAVSRGPRGNEEWGPGDGCTGLVQAYNHVIRVCGDAGGTELALRLLEAMPRR